LQGAISGGEKKKERPGIGGGVNEQIGDCKKENSKEELRGPL
jgi:hypothetical protein